MRIWLYSRLINPTFYLARKRVTALASALRLHRILDVCTAMGTLPAFLRAQGHAACGLDLDLEKLKYTEQKKRGTGTMLVGGDATKTPFQDKSFDAVTFTYALHDKDKEVRNRILQETARMLKPAGKIIAIDYAPPWSSLSFVGHLIRYITEAFSGHYQNGITFIRKGGIVSYIQEQGFVIETKEYHSRFFSAVLVVAKKP